MEKIKELGGVAGVSYNRNQLEIIYNEGKNNIVKLMEFFDNGGIKYSKIYSERPTLNDVFLELTGKELRD